MSEGQDFTKDQLIEIIEKLEESPSDRVGLLADIGVTALGAAGAGAAAAVFGATTASIPIITALTGIGMVVAAPIGVVAGAAVAGGAAVYGLSRLIKDGGFHDGKRIQLLNEYRERLRDIEAKERQSSLSESDKTEFYSFLKEPLKHNLINPEDAQQLIQAVENGHIPLSEAYKLVGQVLSENQLSHSEKVVTTCPKCNQKLRAPSSLGELRLTCPKCKHSWSWAPK